MNTWTAETLLTAINAFRQSRIILTADETGIWKALDEGPQTFTRLATICGLEARATNRLLDALCALELLEKDGDIYSHNDISRKYLSPSSPEYLRNIGHYSNLWNRWSRLTESLHSGTAVEYRPVNDRDSSWLENFIAAMHHRAKTQAPEDVNLLDLHNTKRILDLGGGSGAYAMAMLRVKNELHATVFDLPSVISITRRYIHEAGLEHRTTTLEGDYLVDDIGGQYDLVFLSAIVHSNSAEQNRALVSKCADALNEGGQLVIQDFIIDEDRVRPVQAALFAINMLVGTEAGDTYTEKEIMSWMSDAGLHSLIRKDTRHSAAQIHGRKGVI